MTRPFKGGWKVEQAFRKGEMEILLLTTWKDEGVKCLALLEVDEKLVKHLGRVKWSQ